MSSVGWLPAFGDPGHYPHRCVIQRRPTTGLLPRHPAYEGEHRAVCSDCDFTGAWCDRRATAEQGAQMHPVYDRHSSGRARPDGDPELLTQGILRRHRDNGWELAWYEGDERKLVALEQIPSEHDYVPLDVIVAAIDLMTGPMVACRIEIWHAVDGRGTIHSYHVRSAP